MTKFRLQFRDDLYIGLHIHCICNLVFLLAYFYKIVSFSYHNDIDLHLRYHVTMILPVRICCDGSCEEYRTVSVPYSAYLEKGLDENSSGKNFLKNQTCSI